MIRGLYGQWREVCVACQEEVLGGRFERPEFIDELKRLGWVKGFWGRKCSECVKESQTGEEA